MKILFYISVLGGGGAERVISVVSNGLVKRGHDVHIIISAYSEKDYSYDKKIKITCLPRPTDNDLKMNYLKDLRKLVEEIHPDVMVGVVHLDFYRLWEATKGLGIPIVASDHNNFHKNSSVKIKYVRYYLYNFADVTTVLTQNDFEYMKHKLHNMVVINNPLSFPILEEDTEKEKTILCCGRFDVWYVKGLDLMIRIWSMIAKNHPDWKLQIAGTGKDDIIDFIKHLTDLDNVSDSVEFLGYRKDIKEIMSKASIFVLSSREEGFPCVLTEAMSQGCAPVAFDIRGNIKEIITDGEDGYIVPDDDLEMFAKRLEELIDNEETRKKFRENARVSLKRFEPEKIVDQWEKILTDLVEKKKAE